MDATIFWVLLFYIFYSTFHDQQRHQEVLNAIDSIRAECIGSIETDSNFVESYEEIDTVDYYMEGKVR